MDFIFSALAEFVAMLLLTLLEFLIVVPMIWIGEIVLFLATLGRHAPRWDIYNHRGGTFVFLSTMSFWIGIVFSCGIGVAVKAIFFPSTA